MKYLSIYIILIAMLMGCTSSEPTVVTEPDAKPIQISAGVGLSFAADAISRSSRTTDDSESRVAVLPQTVGLFGEMEGHDMSIFYNQLVYHRGSDAYDTTAHAEHEGLWPVNFTWPTSNDWPYAPVRYWTAGREYQFYCYAPHSSVENTNVTLTANSYGAMKNFVETKIPPYSAHDYTVAKEYIYQNQTQNGGVVPFEMSHLSARVCIRIRIGEKYAELRNIRVTKVSINDRADGGSYYQCQVDFNAAPATNTIKVSTNGEYTPTSTNSQIELIPIFNDPDGLKLETKNTAKGDDGYHQFGSLYVMPQYIRQLTVNVTYDVYDLENQKVRENQKVSNSIVFDTTTESGKYYNINIEVCPAYLYVLSDNDVKPHAVISPAD